MPSRVVQIVLTGNNTSAVRAINGVGTASEKVAGQSSRAFDQSASRTASTFSRLGTVGATFGVPYASSLALVGSRLEKTSNEGRGFGATLKHVGTVEAVAAGAGIAALATQVGDFVSQGRESARVGRLTESVIQSTGGAAGVTAGQVSSLAQAQSVKVGVDDELIQSGENVLLTFTHVRNETGKSNDVFTQGITAAEDLSAALGQDLQSSVIQIGKALNDPIRGMTALRRVGVSFTEQQQDQIKALAKSGNLLAAQKVILRELQTEFGGAAAAAADPFSKLAVRVENLKERVGLGLIPVILHAGQAGVTMGHGLAVANTASGGLLGSAAALTAGIPLAFLAVDKLASGTGNLVDRVGGLRGASAAAAAGTELQASSADAAGVAQARLTVALDGQQTAIARAAGANEALATAQARAATAGQGNVAASQELVAADNAAATAQARLAAASERVTVASQQVAVAQGEEAAATQTAGQRVSSTVSQLGLLAIGLVGARFAAGAASEGFNHLTGNLPKKFEFDSATQSLDTFGRTGQVTGLLADAFGNHLESLRQNVARVGDQSLWDKISEGARKVTTLVPGATKTENFENSEKAVRKLDTALSDMASQGGASAGVAAAAFEQIKAKAIAGGAGVDVVNRAFNDYLKTVARLGAANPAAKIQGDVEIAKAQYAQLLSRQASGAAVSTGALAAARQNLISKSSVLAGVENKVNTAQAQGQRLALGAAGALDSNAGAAQRASFAYLGLASNVTTAAQAMAAINSITFGPLTASINADQAQAQFQDALTGLNAPASGGGGGSSGSGVTATAAALDRADKEATLRDAIQGVGDADVDARAKQDALTAARRTYNDVMHGVAANTVAAREAEEAYTQAQDNAKSSVLDLRDANRQLADALEARRIAGREANENIGSSARSVASARLDVTDARAALERANETEDPEKIARAKIALGDAIQRERDAEEALAKARKDKAELGKKDSKVDDDVRRARIGVTEASIKNQQAERDLTEALRILNGTLHGFPAASREAKDAQDQLTQASRDAREAQDNQRDSARQLFRAQADLDGKLTSMAGSGGGIGKAVSAMDSLKVRMDNVKSAGIQMAQSAGQAAYAAGRGLTGLFKAEIGSIQSIIDKQPQLAAAFDPILTQLQLELQAQLDKEAASRPSSGGRPKNVPAGNTTVFAAGGPIPGNDPTGIPILAHPGEYVVRAKAVEKYGLHAMDALNAGRAELPRFDLGGPITNTTNIDARAASPSTHRVDNRSTASSVAGPRRTTHTNTALTSHSHIEGKAHLPKFALGGPVTHRTLNDNRGSSSSARHSQMASYSAGGTIAITNARSGDHVTNNEHRTTATNRTVSAQLPHFAQGGPISSELLRWLDTQRWFVTAPGLKHPGTVNPYGPQGATLALHGDRGNVHVQPARERDPRRHFGIFTTDKTATKFEKEIVVHRADFTRKVHNRDVALQYLASIAPAAHEWLAHLGGHGVAQTGDDPRVPGHSIEEWAADLLGALRLPATPTNVATMVNWAAHESGGYRPSFSGGLNNPLNTTEPWPNSTEGGAQGNIRNYATFWDGISAQAQNLRSPKYGYPAILHGLADQNPRETYDAIDRSQFGTHNLAAGGIVKARPGGTLVRVGEAGKDEAVVPLSAGGRHELAFAAAPSVRPTASLSTGGARTVINEYHWHQSGPVIGDQVDRFVLNTIKRLRSNGHDVDTKPR